MHGITRNTTVFGPIVPCLRARETQTQAYMYAIRNRDEEIPSNKGMHQAV